MQDLNLSRNPKTQVEKIGIAPVVRGGAATIWSGHWLHQPDGEKLAIKVIILNTQVPKDTIKRRLEEEIRVWKQLSHRNILKLHGWIEDIDQFGEFPALVSPWCVHGSLGDLLVTMQGRLDRLLRYSIIRDFTDGLHYMHTAPTGPVMHGDLKSANILIADGFVAKIADFGLSRTVKKFQSEQTMTVVGPGTLRWMSPEAVHNYTEGLEPLRPSSATDIWAWGHLVYETVTGKIPYSQWADYPALQAIMRGNINPRPAANEPNTDMFLSELFWPILEACWAFDPRERPRITQIMQAGPFADIPSGQNDNSLLLHEDPARFDSAWRYKKQGDAAYKRGKYQEALDYYRKARQIFERIGDLVRHANCLRDLGWTYIALKGYDDARTCIMQARDILVRIGDLKGQLNTLQDLAMVERAAKNPMMARKYLATAYKGCQDAGLYVRSGWCLVATGLLDVDDKNWPAAHICFNDAANIAMKEGDQGLLGRSRERQGDCYMRQEDQRGKARRCYDDAARAYRSLRSEQYQVDRVEAKIQECHTIRYEDINAMPLWNYRIMDDSSETPPPSGPPTTSGVLVSSAPYTV